MKIIVTGANGFLGRSTCKRLKEAQHTVLPVVRSDDSGIDGATNVGSMSIATEWQPVLDSVHCVVHCAARVHVMDDPSNKPLKAFRQMNVDATLRLAEQSASAGVNRFVYLSSLKVLGEASATGKPFSNDSPANPQDPYGQSKWEAEMGLLELASRTNLEVVIIRPPLVYGPGVKANFLSLVRAIARGTPLPLGAIHNRRSLVALDNLCDLIRVCVEHPAAAGQTLLVSDGKDVSTPDLARAIGTALGRPARLLPVPVSWLHLAGRLSGRAAQIERITGSLQVDIGHTMQLLGWAPRVTLQQQLQSLAQHYRS